MLEQENDNEQQIKRITFKSLWSDLLSIINLEKGVFFTLKELLIRPYQTIETYLKVDRKRYANPLRLLVFSSAIYALLSASIIFKSDDNSSLIDGEGKDIISFNFSDSSDTLATDSFELDSLEIEKTNLHFEQYSLDYLLTVKIKELDKFNQTNLAKELQRKLFHLLLDNLSKFTEKFIFIILPVYALFTFLFFRKKTGYNFTENLVLNAFLISVMNCIAIVLLPLNGYMDSVLWALFFVVLLMSYTIYYWYKVFALRKFKGFLIAFFTFILTNVIYLVLILFVLRFFVFDDLLIQLEEFTKIQQ